MDFALPEIFVLSSSNTLATTGTPITLTDGQFTVYGPDKVPATAGDITSDSNFFLAQGRPAALKDILPSKKTTPIYKTDVVEWYKITASSSSQNQITTISDFKVQCGDTLTVSLSIDSFYSRQAYYNNLSRSFTAVAPCCDCGDDVCEDLDPQALVDDLVEQINANTQVNVFVTASRGSSGATSTLILTGKAAPTMNTSADPTTNLYFWDKLDFRAFVYDGPETSQDPLVWDLCDQAGTVTLTQSSTVARGTAPEFKALEDLYMMFDTHDLGKTGPYSNVNFNFAYFPRLQAGTSYDAYFIRWKAGGNVNQRVAFSDTVPYDYRAVILNPTGQNAGTIAVLTAALGTPEDKS